MIVDPVAQALHHKHTIGGTLTAEELAHLQQWYAEMDADEAAMFARAREREGPDSTQAAIDAVMQRIAVTAKQIQTLDAEIERRRSEIAALERHLAQKKLPQSA